MWLLPVSLHVLTMDVLFGRNKKEQLEPVKATVTGEHLVSTAGSSFVFR